jgi:hypothetical protein
MPGFSRQTRFATGFSWWCRFGEAFRAGFSRASLVKRKSPAEAGWGVGLYQATN